MSIPKYFAVKRTDCPEWDEYIKWLNKTYGQKYSGNGQQIEYYGFDGSTDDGTNCYANPKGFKNNPTIFESATEFMKLINGVEFEHGELVEVSCDGKNWLKYKFECMLKNGKYLILEEYIDHSIYSAYTYCRKIKEPELSEIISPERFRELADWFDFYGLLNKSDGEVQADLRRFADALEKKNK